MQTQQIPFNKLRLSPANVRKRGAEIGLDALAGSIATHGLLQPVIVSPAPDKKSLYYVHAGGRRWRAIARLIEGGQLPKDTTVDARVCNDETAALAEEISLAENLIRQAMSPADECEGYRAIIDKGATEEDVARRFGVTVRHVQGRLRLADLAEPIFAALANGEITLDIAKAYGSTSDRDAQLAAWNEFNGNWQGGNPQTIRRRLTDSAIDATGPVALFVGEADYLAAGGRVERDLFAANGEGQWLDRDLAENLALKKLEQEAETLAQSEKLAWVRPILASNIPYDAAEGLRDYWRKKAPLDEASDLRMTEIVERMQAIEEEIEDAEDEPAIEQLECENDLLSAEYDQLNDSGYIIPEEDLPHVGTFLLINGNGEPVLASRYYTTAPAKREKAAPGAKSTGDPANLDASLPRALEEQLAKDRRDVLALHVAQDPGLALDMAIFNLARRFAGYAAYNDTGCAVTIGELFTPAGLSGTPPTTATVELDAIQASLPCEWASIEDSFASFLAFRELEEADKAAWLAYAVSKSLKASLASGTHANSFQTELGAMLEIETAEHWRPGAENFFDRIRKPQILGILGKIDAELPGRYASAKKSELSSTAAKLCAGETIATAEVKSRALSWVPEVMSFTAARTDVEPEAASPDTNAGDGLPQVDERNDQDAGGADGIEYNVTDRADEDADMAEAA